MDNLDPTHLKTLRLPKLWELFREHVGDSTRCPNKTFLIRKITGAAAAKPESIPAPAEEGQAWTLDPEELAELETSIPTALPTEEEAGDEPEPPREAVKLTALSVPELRERYLEVIGRPTRSHDKRYLVWKLRQARKGRVRIGPSRSRGAEKAPRKVLPLRLPVPHIEALDAAWRRSDHPSRTDFMRGALSHYLRHLGEPETAELFTSEASS